VVADEDGVAVVPKERYPEVVVSRERVAERQAGAAASDRKAWLLSESSTGTRCREAKAVAADYRSGGLNIQQSSRRASLGLHMDVLRTGKKGRYPFAYLAGRWDFSSTITPGT
jgi:hypothetical protein